MNRILLIEDDQWLAEVYQSALSAYECTIVSSGQAALDAVEANQFDLIIADIMLVNGTAIDVFHDLQSYQATASIPVIVCSTLVKNMSLDDLRAYGVVELLDKATVTPASLREAAQRCLHVDGDLHG